MARLILGHTTNDSIKIWVRGRRRWPIAFVDVLDSADRRTSPTQVIPLEEEEFWTHVLTWTGLSPDRPYRVKVAFGKTDQAPDHERVRAAYTEGRFRTFPRPQQDARFSFVLGSCNLHSLGAFKNPDKVWGRVSEVAARHDARFMLHCGDQIYSDIPFKPRPDPDHYRRKYLDAWDDCRPARRFLTEAPQYMVLDDHEITNNFDNDMDDDHEALCRVAMKVYWEFQHSHNPDTPKSPRQYYYDFNCGSTRFFVLDTRYRRSSDAGEMIDSVQMAALKNWLSHYADDIKFVISSVPFVGQVKRPKKDKWCDPVYSDQRNEIFEHLLNNQIERTIFLTGDMHHSYHATAQVRAGANQVTVHELMSSPINQVTPDVDMAEKYLSPHSYATPNGSAVRLSIRPTSFYGNHSNVMVIDVDGNQVGYQIYRTRDSGRAAKSGRFNI